MNKRVYNNSKDLKCTWQIFLFAPLNFPNVLIMISIEKKFDGDFPSPFFDEPKTWHFTSGGGGGVRGGGYKKRRLGRMWRHFRASSLAKNKFLRHFLMKSALLYHFVANWLAQNDWEIRFSQSLKPWHDVIFIPSLLFLVSRFCTPPEVKFHVFGISKLEEEKSLSKSLLCYTYKYIEEI